MIMSERELEEIENEISAVLKEENEEAEFRTQVIGEFALNLIEDFRRSQSEVAELQERVGELQAMLQKCLTYLTTTIDVVRRRHPELIPEAGLVEEALEEEVRAALSQAKLENQGESVEKPEVES